MVSGVFDLIVLGAGPAGVGAAVTARAHGLSVLVVDENETTGGQVYRATPPAFATRADAPANPDKKEGAAQRQRLLDSGAAVAFRHSVWQVSPGFRVDAVGQGGPVHWTAPAVIAATGTTERVVPFPGWTLPGVIGLAAATILLKSQQMLPGRRPVIAGCGPLLAAVAVAVLDGGGKPAAVLDLSGPGDWLAALPALASRPDLALRGMGWVARLKSAGVPVRFRTGIAEVRETAHGLAATLCRVDAERRPVPGSSGEVIETDCVAVGHGLTPGTEITRLLRARHRFDAALGGWVAEHDADFRTSLPGLYVAGDGAGISGAAAAHIQGQLAGLAVARDLGRIDETAHGAAAAPIRKRLAAAQRFGRAMARLMALRPAHAASVAPDTVVCRCEDVTRGEIDDAIAAGAREVNQLKAWTRCGMGPCQGRMCGETAASLVAEAVGSREAAGLWTGRAPLRPVPMDLLTGDFTYADIPLPKAAPL